MGLEFAGFGLGSGFSGAMGVFGIAGFRAVASRIGDIRVPSPRGLLCPIR